MNGNGRMTEYEIEPRDSETLQALAGIGDVNFDSIETATGARIMLRDGKIIVAGEDYIARHARDTVERLIDMITQGETVDFATVRYASDMAAADAVGAAGIDTDDEGFIAVTARGRRIRCKTVGQRKYVDAMKKNTVTFSIGPAGTGKTYLAMAMAVVAFKNKEVERIILTRPAVEAGEKLGFLPGDLQNKVDPYLRPLYDALYDFMGAEGYKRLAERGAVEVAPLAYMRGRTLTNSYIILDEAQNCTVEQMKMFLTRFGEGSKVVITGDVTQTDLPADKTSGLKHAVRVLSDVEGIATIRLTHRDVVRHSLVQSIIRAYEAADKR